MGTLHRTLESRRPRPMIAIRPSILVTLVFLGAQWVVHLLGVLSARELADTFYGSALYLDVARVVAVLLVPYVAVDVWRGRDATGRAGAVTIIVVATGGLLAHAWYLTRFAALLGR